MANSLLSGVSGKVKGRGRGRPRKSAQLDPDDIRSTNQLASGTSQISGDGKTAPRGTKSVVSARSGFAEQEEDYDGEDDELVENMDEQERRQAEEEETRLEQRRERLADTLDLDQYARYNQWRALSLNNSTVKRLVNSIVSQSVTSAPLQAIRIYGKWFVGEIVERAREVQTECAKAYEETRKEERKRREEELLALEEKQKHSDAGDPQSPQSRLLARDIERLKREAKEYIPNPHKGGLLPDHLREALRRYKNDGEGGGVGFSGQSHGLLGVPGPAAWRVGDGASGRRLFR
jgi:transcription initiation factor TFIID subunit 11